LPDAERPDRLQAGNQYDQTNDQGQDRPANENVSKRFHLRIRRRRVELRIGRHFVVDYD